MLGLSRLPLAMLSRIQQVLSYLALCMHSHLWHALSYSACNLIFFMHFCILHAALYPTCTPSSACTPYSACTPVKSCSVLHLLVNSETSETSDIPYVLIPFVPFLFIPAYSFSI